MSLTRENILQAQDRVTQKVEIQEWGGDIFVRSMTGRERTAYESQFDTYRDSGTKPPPVEIMARLLVATTVDENGAPLFTDNDIPTLSDKNSVVLSRIFEASMKLNNIGAAQVEKLKGNS